MLVPMRIFFESAYLVTFLSFPAPFCSVITRVSSEKRFLFSSSAVSRIRALDKDDDKIYLFWTFSREKGGNIFFIIRFRAVRFDDRNAAFPDGFHLRTIGIYHQDLIFFAKYAPYRQPMAPAPKTAIFIFVFSPFSGMCFRVYAIVSYLTRRCKASV